MACAQCGAGTTHSAYVSGGGAFVPVEVTRKIAKQHQRHIAAIDRGDARRSITYIYLPEQSDSVVTTCSLRCHRAYEYCLFHYGIRDVVNTVNEAIRFVSAL